MRFLANFPVWIALLPMVFGMAGFGDILKSVKSETPAARKRELTPEQLAQEPVYVRFTKAEIELVEDSLWKSKDLPEGQSLTPRTMAAVFKAYLEGAIPGLKFENAAKVLKRPNVIRR